jgi:hypothetical protein
MRFEVLTSFRVCPHLKLASGVGSFVPPTCWGYTAWLPWRIQFKDKEKAWLSFDLESELQSNLFGRQAGRSGRQAAAKSFICSNLSNYLQTLFHYNACISLHLNVRAGGWFVYLCVYILWCFSHWQKGHTTFYHHMLDINFSCKRCFEEILTNKQKGVLEVFGRLIGTGKFQPH